MEWIIENWYILLALVCVVALAVYGVVFFLRQPRPKQLEALREWLLFAVIEAEKHLGGGTGKIKLRLVYDMFLKTFPWLAKAISFEQFSFLVDEALEKMRDLLEKNANIKGYVKEGE